MPITWAAASGTTTIWSYYECIHVYGLWHITHTWAALKKCLLIQSALPLALHQSSVTSYSVRVRHVCLKSTAEPHLETQRAVLLVHLAFGWSLSTAHILTWKEAHLWTRSKLLLMSTKPSMTSPSPFLPHIAPPVRPSCSSIMASSRPQKLFHLPGGISPLIFIWLASLHRSCLSSKLPPQMGLPWPSHFLLPHPPATIILQAPILFPHGTY